jgi:hypothetical protein
MFKVDGITRRGLLLASAGAALAPARAQAAGSSPVVVELFTSQGCSSCPPADAFLADLAKMKGVMALTYHVDYWDYLGWKDTFGSPDCSQRQYDYANGRGDMDVYTPQMIVHGGKHYVGSNRDGVTNALALVDGGPPVAISVTAQDSEMVLEVGEGSADGDTMLWMLPVTSEAKVKILKGEIAGREITYNNIVRKIIPAGMWHGKAQRIALPRDAILTEAVDSCVAILQKGKAGHILACAGWGKIVV